mmetsp:Transcript_266/g.685  ORF Transcript_266/g.685 Transcript_266/m.685 type:complete len:255 (+) Transcript_266:642-1406(+)
MDANGSIDEDQLFQFGHDAFGVGFCFNQGQTAKFGTSTTDQVPFNHTNIDFQTRVAIDRGFSQQGFHLSFVDIGKNDILFDGQSDFSTRVLIGQIRQFTAFLGTQSSDGHHNSDAHLTLLGLRMDTRQFSSFKGLGGFGLGLVAFDAPIVRVHFAHHLGPEFFDTVGFHQPHETSLGTILAFSFITKDAQNGFGQGHDGIAIGGDPQINRNGMSDTLNTHVPTQHDIESHFSRRGVTAGLQSDIVNVCVGVVIA